MAASEDGALAYTGYRGGKSVLGALAGSVGDLLEVQLDPDGNILLTPGTQAGLFTALSALVESGNRVALMDPDYLFTARIVRVFPPAATRDVAQPACISERWNQPAYYD